MKKPKILIVDDEKNIVNVLKEYCSFNEFSVDCAYNGMDALALAQENNYDCIVIDVMMPILDGFETVKEIRKIKTTPIIMITARGEEYDKLHGFKLGVDDYIVKPFSPKEVMARIKAVIKRTKSFVDYLKLKDLKLSLEDRLVFVFDKEVSLTNKEFELLVYLIQNKNLSISREKLLINVWGFDTASEERTVDTHIKMLRAHLGECGKYIKTIRGIGYKFEIK